ncbi:MAG: hypothetical protein AAFO76_08245 [Cyanobacteria bacterium J06607_15]
MKDKIIAILDSARYALVQLGNKHWWQVKQKSIRPDKQGKPLKRACGRCFSL